jgi:hypothetical protein
MKAFRLSIRTARKCRRLAPYLAALLLGLVAALSAAEPADAARLMSRGEIVSRAYSALATPYSQDNSLHVKCYVPDEKIEEGEANCGDEPFIDCSGLLQKCWQLPDQIYPGNWSPPTQPTAEYNAQNFYDCVGSWYQITPSSLVRGDGMSSGGHCVVYIDTTSDWRIIEAASTALGTVFRVWPSNYNKASFRALRRTDIEGSYQTEVILDNPTAWQTNGPVTYSCPYFHDWSKSASVVGYQGIDYQYHAGTATGTEAVMRYTPWIPASGNYAVYVRHPAYSSYGSAVKVTVRWWYGATTYYVNETTAGGTWKYLGTHNFSATYNPYWGSVVISTYGTPGNKHVVADADKFVRQ